MNNIPITRAEMEVHPSTLRKTKVLIVDDNETNIKVLGSLLRNHSYEVLTASDALNGINIASVKQPDLILLDIMMPDIDGFETFKLLSKNEKTKEIPVIYLTGLDNTKSLIKGFELGAVDYITKPYNHAELVARIATRVKQNREFVQEKALFKSNTHTFITLDENLNITNFNSTADKRHALQKDVELKVGVSFLMYFEPEQHKFIKRRLENVLCGKVVEFEQQYTRNKQVRWMNYIIEPMKDRLGKVNGCLICGTDITSKKATELEDADYLQKINDIFDGTQQSLRYASNIQTAIFPGHAQISKQFDDSFVLFKPKEKVSGDFYWSYELGDKTLLLLGDCTGHGVPGALLTTMSIVLIERIVKYQNILSPEKILVELNNNIINILNQRGGGIKDGLEMGVCLFDKTTGTIEFAGARRPIFIVKGSEFQEFKGARQEIGGTDVKSFCEQTIQPEKGSAIYIFSDGFPDQIGGPDNKKYLKKRLKDLIQTNSHLPMDEQHLAYRTAMDNWIGSEEQTDDILLIGVRF